MGVFRRTGVLVFVALIASMAFADGVVTTSNKQVKKERVKTPFVQVGRATYYHKSLHGMRTATGERFDSQAMTAAHRRLKLGAYVRVTNLRNQRSVAVRINDRLPPRSRAIIDLSIKAARHLGMVQRGVAKVKLEVISGDEYLAASSAR